MSSLASISPEGLDLTPAHPTAWKRSYALAAFLIGCLGTLAVRLVGEMPVSELIVILLLSHAALWVVLTSRLPAAPASPRLLIVFLTALGVSLLGYVISDLYRDSTVVDMLRGWARWAFLALDIVCFALLFGHDWRSFALVQAGAVLSAAGPMIKGPLFGDWWKFCFALPVAVFVFLAVPRLFGYWGAVVASFGLAAANQFMDFRSLSMVSAGVGGMLLLMALPRVTRRIFIVVGVLVGLGLLPIVYDRMVNKASGRASMSNVERGAMLEAAWEGFEESPVIGHGSWFSRSDIMDRFREIRTINAKIFGTHGFDEMDEKVMAIHSQILVSLAEGGLFGAAFFFLFGGMLCWGLWFVTASREWDWLTPSFLYVLTVAMWNFWMSPFSGQHRVEIALAVGVVLGLWTEKSQAQRALHV
jgi:hypothetical protein